jgi:hypothetical protein
VVLQIETFAQTEFVVLGVVPHAVLLPRHGGAWMVVASLSGAGRIRICVTVLGLLEPTVERSEFFKNALCSLSEAHWHHEAAEPSRTNLTENVGLCILRGLFIRV